MKLCKECQDWINHPEKRSHYNWTPMDHCHHSEPEEKPKEKCWCERNLDFFWRYKQPTELGFVGFNPVFCPECGRKL